MKKLLIALICLAAIAVNAQYVDLSEYLDRNRMWEMADSNMFQIRTEAAVNAATGVTNAAAIAVNVADIDTLESPPHGSLSFQDSAFVLDLTQNTFSVITNAGNDLWNVMDASGLTIAGDTLTIILPGDYLVVASLSFSGTASDVFEFAIFENGVIASPKLERSTSQTDIGNISLPFYIEDLVVGDDLSLRITNSASSDDATLVAGSWVTWRLHE